MAKKQPSRPVVSLQADKDNFVNILVRDPVNPPALTLLCGYPGKSAEKDHLRLYLAADLSQWIDIPIGAILHRKEIPSHLQCLQALLVWVRKDITLYYRHRQNNPAPQQPNAQDGEEGE